MKRFATICAPLSLILCAACTTDSPLVVRKELTQTPRVPASLIQPCPPAWSKTGGPAITKDFVDRGDQNEAALRTCAAQVAGVAAWDAANVEADANAQPEPQ